MAILEELQRAGISASTDEGRKLVVAFDQAWALAVSSGSPIAEDRYSAEARLVLARCIVDRFRDGIADLRELVSEGITCLAMVKLSSGGHVASAAS